MTAPPRPGMAALPAPAVFLGILAVFDLSYAAGYGTTSWELLPPWQVFRLFALHVLLVGAALAARRHDLGSLGKVLRRELPRRWARYCYGPGCAYGYALCRLALLAAFLGVYASSVRIERAGDPGFYEPIGLLVLLGSQPPPPGLLAACQLVFWVTWVCALLGLFSRLSWALCLLSLCLLSAVLPSTLPAGWSHGSPPVLLAGLAFLGAPPSRLSLDAWWRRRREGALPPEWEPAYQRPLRLAQLVAGLMFLNAACYKLFLGNWEPLRWVFSDNLHAIVLYQYWLLSEELPAYLAPLVASSSACRWLAAGNIVAQAAPILACVFVRRPWLRAACAGLFLAETLGLYLVMGLWNGPFLALALPFLPWERWAPSRAPAGGAAFRPRTRGPALLGSAAFIGCFVWVAFTQPRSQRWTYPFTSFPMYSSLRVRAPYDQPQAARFPGLRWDIAADPPLSAEARQALRRAHYAPLPPAQLKATARGLARQLAREEGCRIRRIEVWEVDYVIPPPPALRVQAGPARKLLDLSDP